MSRVKRLTEALLADRHRGETERTDITKCFMCGTNVGPDKSQVTYQQRFCSFVKFALIFSSILTVASIFTNFVPSFTKCMVATMILGLVNNSAQQMWQNR